MSQSDTDTGIDAIPASELVQALRRSLLEEIESVKKLVDDEDSDCIVRDFREARLEGLQFALRLVNRAESWEW